MRFFSRWVEEFPLQKWIAAGVIAALSAGMVISLWSVPQWVRLRDGLNSTFYNWFYTFRPLGDCRDGSVVIIGIDDNSRWHMAQDYKFGWPWPREFYGVMAQYVQRHGAKAMAIDLTFDGPSFTSGETPDDQLFADAINSASIPCIFAVEADPTGKISSFAPPVVPAKRTFGAANVMREGVQARKSIGEDIAGSRRVGSVMTYVPVVSGVPSLALSSLRAAGLSPASWGNDPFLLHYYGPSRPIDRPDAEPTFRYVAAYNVVKAASAEALGEDPARFGIDPKWFEGKIVLLGAIGRGTVDLKTTPLDADFPGVEIHATAIENLLRGQHVHPASTGTRILVTCLAAGLAAAGATLFRRVWVKLLAILFAGAAMVALGITLFLGYHIFFLPVATPLIGATLAGFGALGWSYVTEDRGRQFMLKALSQYVSPDVAQEIARNPQKLGLSGERREMTVMFSDIAGFTDMSERMSAEQLTDVLNYYLREMSEPILDLNGTLDKYIGDAIMAFWNAPLSQDDHAYRCCLAALRMRDCERRIQPQLAQMGAEGMYTRFGINSGMMAVGNMGSTRKIGYTVIGDAVNLSARLEGANKFYGTQIIVTQSTADFVKGQFVLRPLDVIRVKGKKLPMPIYQLLAEAPVSSGHAGLIEMSDEALKLYQKQQWDAAERLLHGIQAKWPDDGPAKTFLDRIAEYRAQSPGADWDGVFEATSK